MKLMNLDCSYFRRTKSNFYLFHKTLFINLIEDKSYFRLFLRIEKVTFQRIVNQRVISK